MSQQIDRDAYLAHAMNLTEKECQLIDEFVVWLPQDIIDCHAHCNLPSHVRSVDERAFGHMLSTFAGFTLEKSKEWKEQFYPGKNVRTLRFPKTFRGVDHRQANLYLLRQSPAEDRIAVYGLPDDAEYTIGMLAHQQASALKMYHSYLEPPATEIYSYFPPDVLEEAQGMG